MKMMETMLEGLQRARDLRECGGDHISEYVNTAGRMAEALINEDIEVSRVPGERVLICVALGVAYMSLRDDGLDAEDKDITEAMINEIRKCVRSQRHR